MEQLAITIQETLETTTLGKTKVYELIAEGKLKAIKVGRRTLVTTESVRTLISQNSSKSTP